MECPAQISEKFSPEDLPIVQILLKSLSACHEAQKDAKGFSYLEVQVMAAEDLKAFQNPLISLKAKSVFLDMGLKDCYFVSEKGDLYSLVQSEGYHKASEFMTLFLHLREEHKSAFIETANFTEYLANFLKPAAEVQLKPTSEKPMFFDGSVKIPKVMIVSYPRSGNTMSRQMVQQLTLAQTGSNMKLVNNQLFELLRMGLHGEGLLDDKVWFVKSHYPIDDNHSFTKHEGSFGLVVVRNPLNVMISQFNFLVTESHCRSIQGDFDLDFKEVWEKGIRVTTLLMKKFFSYWIEMAKTKQFPVHFIRFEDLIKKAESEKVWKEAFEAVIGQNIDGSAFEERIKHWVKQPNFGQVYPLKNARHKKTIEYYTKEMIEVIKQDLRKELYFFGYADKASDDQCSFKFEDESQDDLAHFNGYKAVNEENKKWYWETKAKLDEQEPRQFYDKPADPAELKQIYEFIAGTKSIASQCKCVGS